jgi:exopolysaccharide biosynthesis polyprenyl glycosylphosphotransferase
MRLTRQMRSKITLLAVDMCFLVVAMSLATLIRLGRPLFIFHEYRGATGFCVILYPLALYFLQGYEMVPQATLVGSLRRPIVGALFASLLASFFFYFALHWRFGRGIFVIMNVLFLIFLAIWRTVFFVESQRRRHRVLVVGNPEPTEAACEILIEHLPSPTIIVPPRNGDEPMESPPSEVATEKGKEEIDLVVLAGHSLPPSRLRSITELRFRGVPVWDLPRLYSELAERLPAQHIGDMWLATTDGFHFFSRHTLQYVKRLSDIATASLGLILSLPLWLLAMTLIKLEDGGAVFYSQERIGQWGHRFLIHKFRTMIPQAEKETGPVWSTQGDPRLTRAGRILRKLRIDEIPQMWNVLRGDMSFVGPRPERPVFVEVFERKYPIYDLRHSLRPGITGWAQVKFPYGASERDTLRKLEYDLYYIQNFSVFFDLRILLKTISIVLSGRGAR